MAESCSRRRCRRRCRKRRADLLAPNASFAICYEAHHANIARVTQGLLWLRDLAGCLEAVCKLTKDLLTAASSL